MNRRKQWAIVLTVFFLVIAVVELSRANYLLAGFYSCLHISAALMSVSVPVHKTRKHEVLLDLSYLSLLSALFLYGAHIILPGLK